jgi:hypothetical protein
LEDLVLTSTDQQVAKPTVQAFINFSTGPSFGEAAIIGSAIFGKNIFADTATTVVDVSDQVDMVRIVRGRQAIVDQFQTGSMTLRIIDQNGDFNPENPASPYAGLLSPMRKVFILGVYNGVSYPLFAGYITGYNTALPLNSNDVARTTITAVDGFRLANLASVTTVTGAVAGELSGSRINKILNMINWPTSMRDVDPGLTTLQADPGTNRTALAAMQTVETSEFGSLYVDASGNFTFQDRSVTASSIVGTPTLFSDYGETGIDYFDAKWVLDDKLIYNAASITRTGGTAQVTTDAASIEKYFLHSYSQTNLLMETDADAMNYGKAYIASRKDTSIRCDEIQLDLFQDNYDAGIEAGLGLDYFDPVTISTNQPGGTNITKTLQIFGVEHDIRPGVWRTNLTTLEPIIDSFIIGYGIIGQSVLSY